MDNQLNRLTSNTYNQHLSSIGQLADVQPEHVLDCCCMSDEQLQTAVGVNR
jgi:hypothetical protein